MRIELEEVLRGSCFDSFEGDVVAQFPKPYLTFLIFLIIFANQLFSLSFLPRWLPLLTPLPSVLLSTARIQQ
jgi:hypothetical protein